MPGPVAAARVADADGRPRSIVAAVADHRVLLVALTAAVGVAWGSLAVWSGSPAARYLDHRNLGQEGLTAVTLGLFVAGWFLMTVAMMLPTSAPLILTFRAIVGRRPRPGMLTLAVVAAYVTTWTAVGLGLFVLDAGVHRVVDGVPWLDAHAYLITSATLVAAGAYQFSPLKYRCLDACQSPLMFVMGHWHGERPTREALALGARHAAFCIGCCWSLMLVLFALGMGNLAWMLGIGAVMAVEKNQPAGRRLGPALGVGLIVAGVAALSV